jgi:hypothetical protein
MCVSFEDTYMTVESLFFNLSDVNEVYLLEAGKVPKLISKDELEAKTQRYNDPDGRYKTSGPKRILRGKRARLIQYDLENAPKKYGQGFGVLHYLVKSKENTTDGKDPSKGHRGYIVYYKSNHRIKHMFCDCKDFFYRLYAPYVNAGLSTWDIDSRYKKYMHQQHNKEWTKDTNPAGKIFICKHLYRAINDVFDKDMFDKILDTDYEQKKQEKKLRQTIAKQIGDREPEPEPEKKKAPPKKLPKKEPEPEDVGEIEKELTKDVKKKELPKKKPVVPVKKEPPKKPEKVPDVKKKIGELPGVGSKKPEVKKPDVKKNIKDLKSDKSSFEKDYDEKDKKK